MRVALVQRREPECFTHSGSSWTLGDEENQRVRTFKPRIGKLFWETLHVTVTNTAPLLLLFNWSDWNLHHQLWHQILNPEPQTHTPLQTHHRLKCDSDWFVCGLLIGSSSSAVYRNAHKQHQTVVVSIRPGINWVWWSKSESSGMKKLLVGLLPSVTVEISTSSNTY